jgi:superfamily I DNA/RNA helicase
MVAMETLWRRLQSATVERNLMDVGVTRAQDALLGTATLVKYPNAYISLEYCIIQLTVSLTG